MGMGGSLQLRKRLATSASQYKTLAPTPRPGKP